MTLHPAIPTLSFAILAAASSIADETPSATTPATPVETLICKLEQRGGMPVMLINGMPQAPVMLWGGTAEMIRETIRLARPNGVRLYTTCITLPWPREGEPYDFTAVNKEFADLVRLAPDGYYMPRVSIVPPEWWRNEHPEELPVWENGGREKDDVSVTSEKWLDGAARHLDALVRHLEARWGDRIFAYHPSAMNSGEWYYTSTIWNHNDWGLRHFEPGFRDAWRQWLAARYKEIGGLNTAWGTEHAGFAAIDVPPAVRRKSTSHGLLRNPVAEREMLDFSLFQSQAITDAIRRVSAAIRGASGGRKLVHVFYGYTYELAGLQEGIVNFGHLDFERAMDERFADVWCAPMGYYDRRNGGSGTIMAPAESCAFRGQPWCNEDDLRTHLADKDTGWGRVSTLDETIWAHRRNFMTTLVHRSQIWFMPQGDTWLADAKLWDNLGRLQKLYDETNADPAPLTSDTAVIVDEASLMQISYGIEIGLPLLYDLRAQINRMGLTPELWLQSDYVKGRVSPKKFVIFLNAFSTSVADRNAIRSRLKADGSTALWFYAPGVLQPDAKTPDAAYGVRHIEALTGIRVNQLDGEQSPSMKLANGHRWSAGCGAGEPIEPDDVIRNWKSRDEAYQYRQMTWPPRAKLGPLFAVNDPQAEAFGHYAEGGAVAMASKRDDGFTSVFVGGLTLPAAVFANIATEAGAHVFTPPGDIVYTDGRFLSLTACTAGVKTVTLREGSVVTDALDGNAVGEGRTFEADLKEGETRVYRIAPRK